MTNHSIDGTAREKFVSEMMSQMGRIAAGLVAWLSESAGELGAMEQQVLGRAQELGQALLSGLCGLLQPRYPAPAVACACGGQATYQRMRTVQTTTLLDTIQVRRAYYVCASCRRGVAPLDDQVGLCAGGLSAGLTDLLAFLGVTQASFEQATEVLANLSLVQVCPNSVRQATEALGALVVADEEAQVAAAWADPAAVQLAAAAPERLYLSLDGTMVHVRQQGWKECKVGACFTTTTRPARQRPERLQVQARALSYVADLSSAESFGRLLWHEAARRGVTQAQEVVVLGDGAEWIWRLAAEHFPHATQIVDWYHATQYVWQAAHALHPEEAQATRWAQQALDALWEGRLRDLCANLNKHRDCEPVRVALTYFTNNQARMRYDQFRQRGLQIGSGTIESACKHVVGQRLKLAGMRWNHAEARAMVMLRA